tara:strand:+ start:287 stop:568 length:282 start_codon:yes stop_codon:yes gene_type:complete
MRRLTVLERITARLEETATPCKLYKSEATAERVGEKVALMAANYFQSNHPMNFVVVHVPSIDKYAVAFDMNELLNRSDCNGGYLGVCGDHYTY